MTKHTPVKTLIIVVILAGCFGGLSAFAATDFEKTLAQCEEAFAVAHDKDASRADAAKARHTQLQLTVQLLGDINKRNAELSKEAEPSTKEVLANLRIMGRLLEMLAVEHMPVEAPYSYVY